MTLNSCHALLAITILFGTLSGCDRADSGSGSPAGGGTTEQQAVRLFEQTVGDYSRNALETEVRYDVTKTDSLITPFQAIYHATFVAGNGSRLERRKVFNYRDGQWQVARVEHLDEDGEWVRGAWRGSADEDLSMESYYWGEALKKQK